MWKFLLNVLIVLPSFLHVKPVDTQPRFPVQCVDKKNGSCTQKAFIQQRSAFRCRDDVGADVLLSVDGLGQQEADVVQREGGH